MKPGTLTSAFVTLTGVPGLLFVTTMLRVISCPRWLPVDREGATARPMPETGISSAAAARPDLHGSLTTSAAVRQIDVEFELPPGRPAILSCPPRPLPT
jgi:hypothetical protein